VLYPFDLKKRGVGQLADWVAENEITCLSCVPAVFRQLCALIEAGQSFPCLRTLRLGGDRVVRRDVELFKEHFGPECRLAIGYGATEVKTIAFFWLDHNSQLPEGPVPVGCGVQDHEFLLLDENRCPVAPGEVGEIVARSRYMSPGYWRLPELTALKFQPDPESVDGDDARSGLPPMRLYFTGDLGRTRPDGCLVHLGRADSQIKIRGYRVEIAEIEAAVSDLPGVKEAVVVAHRRSAPPGEGRGSAQSVATDGEKRLVAYIVPRAQPAPTVTEMRRALGDVLPDYMIPAFFVTLDEMPLNVNNKIDRQALPEPETTRPELGVEYVAPRDEVERELVAIWERVLGIEPVGVRDDFFELGGHSLLTVALFAEIQARFGPDVSLRPFFRSPTVEHVAAALRPQETGGPRLVTGRRIKDTPLKGLKNRLLQVLALYAPGAKTTRVRLHRWRGVQIGEGAFVGLGVILESAFPHLVSIGNNVTISVRTVMIAHFKGSARQAREDYEPSVRIEDDVFIGPGVIVLPNVTIGEGAVVAAGSVVNRSVPPQTMVQGNPAQVVARCGVPLKGHSYEEFMRNLQPVEG
jgi:acetyltransferase-like isoleucine patch superfamily enzyme